MGGAGSGYHGWRGGRATTDQFPRLTISGLCFGDLWRRGVGLHIETDGAFTVLHGGYRHHVDIERTPHRCGGHRRWFLCPACERRCAVLHIVRGLLACRHCHKLAYASQFESCASRKLHLYVRKAWQARVL